MDDAPVAVVLLSWNGREDTLACLASLAALPEPQPLTIVVDNGSSDGVGAAVAASFPGVEVLRSERNLGFAGGCNLGLRRGMERGARYLLTLNNDTEVDPGFLAALLAEAGARPDAGALCAKVLYLDPPDRIWFAGARYDPRLGYNGRQRGHRARDDGRFDEVVETDRACAAAMLVRAEVLERVGLFDEELFAYNEDTDWSLRARAAGYRHYVVPASRVWHRVSAGSGGENAPGTLYYGVRNSLEVCERYAPLPPLASARRRALIVSAHLAQALLALRVAGVRAVADGVRDQRARRLGQRSAR